LVLKKNEGWREDAVWVLGGWGAWSEKIPRSYRIRMVSYPLSLNWGEGARRREESKHKKYGRNGIVRNGTAAPIPRKRGLNQKSVLINAGEDQPGGTQTTSGRGGTAAQKTGSRNGVSWGRGGGKEKNRESDWEKTKPICRISGVS